MKSETITDTCVSIQMSDLTKCFNSTFIPEDLSHLPVYDKRSDLGHADIRNWDYVQRFDFTHFIQRVDTGKAHIWDNKNQMQKDTWTFSTMGNSWPAAGTLIPRTHIEVIEIPLYTWSFIKVDSNGSYAGGPIYVGFDFEAIKDKRGLTEVLVRDYVDVLIYVGPDITNPLT